MEFSEVGLRVQAQQKREHEQCQTCVRSCELYGQTWLNRSGWGGCLILSFYIRPCSEQGLGPEISRGLQSLLAITIQTAFHFYLTLHSYLMVYAFSSLWFSSQTYLLWALWSRAEQAVSSVVRGKQDCFWAEVAALLGWPFLFEFQFRSVVNTRLLPWNTAEVCSGVVGQLCVVCSACSPTRASQTYYSDPLA